jgi:hypothetical protein
MAVVPLLVGRKTTNVARHAYDVNTGRRRTCGAWRTASGS